MGRGRQPQGPNAIEHARVVALAARVGRFPLSLPGNNDGRPLSMQLKLQARTIARKYNTAMVKQLLQDYDALPTNWATLSSEGLADVLVAERELLAGLGEQLQDPWTNQRLQTYVDRQEEMGVIPPVGPMVATAPAPIGPPRAHAYTASPPLSAASTSLHGSSRKRDREDDADSVYTSPLQKNPRTSGSTWANANATEVQYPLEFIEYGVELQGPGSPYGSNTINGNHRSSQIQMELPITQAQPSFGAEVLQGPHRARNPLEPSRHVNHQPFPTHGTQGQPGQELEMGELEMWSKPFVRYENQEQPDEELHGTNEPSPTYTRQSQPAPDFLWPFEPFLRYDTKE